MRSGDIYYNPKTNELIEFNREYPFEVCDVDIGIISYYNKVDTLDLKEETVVFPTGPIFGMTKEMFKEFNKIGKV